MNDVLFEDDALLVVDKKPGVIVERLITACPAGYFLAHRLDKDTSGILVIAKGSENLTKLQKQWKNRQVEKTYRVLIHGKLSPKRGRIEAPIFRSVKDRKRMAVSAHPKARDATTEYKVLQYFDDYTLLEAYPRTGRTHQIRVHFSAIGHPVCGDGVYGKTKDDICSRQFLHAYKLTFVHPIKGKRVSFKSPLPTDLQTVLEGLTRP